MTTAFPAALPTCVPTCLPTCVMVAVMTALIVAPLVERCLRPSGRRSPPGARAHRSRHFSFDYASALEAIASEVRSGSSLTNALIDAVDGSSPLEAVADRLRAGASLVDALAEIVPVEVDPADADLALAVQALSATARLGGPIAATLDEAAAVLRERAAARAERRAHGSQARLSARVLTIVPLGFATWSVVASDRTRDVYLSSVVGGICAMCGLVLNMVGWKWMKRIIGPA